MVGRRLFLIHENLQKRLSHPMTSQNGCCFFKINLLSMATPAASLTDEAKGAAGLGKQQKTATPRRDRKFVIQILHKIVMWMGAVT
jgi:hypothetical protein